MTKTCARGTMQKLSEREFMAQVIQLARLRNWLVFHAHDSRRSAKGFPDLILVRGPWLFAIELKVGRGKLTPEQERWLFDLCSVPGVKTFVFYPKDWPLIEMVLE